MRILAKGTIRAASLAALLNVALAPGALAGGRPAVELRHEMIADSGDIEVFVRLETPSVAELNIDAVARTGALAGRAEQMARARRIDSEQAAFKNTLSSVGAVVLSAQRVGANGLRVRVPIQNLRELRDLSGVRSVGRVERHTVDNAESVPWIGTTAAAERFGLTGRGVRIGIIDTGIDYLHANFGGAGSSGEYAANDKNVIESGTFPTARVAGGYDFAGANYNANIPGSNPEPDPDPLDGNGHGSHVAGSAAGLGVAGTIGAGVAPDATLYALKVFGDTTGSTNVTSLAIEWAMDPNGDGDVSDHLDVINMSLGSSFGEPADPSSISTENAVALGIIVVTSAGNSGNVPYITGAPGVAASAISVAATSPGGRALPTVNVAAPASVAGLKTTIEGLGAVQFRAIGPMSGTLVRATPLNGCAPLSNAAEIAGRIALIIRGTCNFVDKYRNAQAAGARALIVYNDGTAPGRDAPFAMGGIASEVIIPGVMISATEGIPLAAVTPAAAPSPVQVAFDVAVSTAFDDQIASFSSAGPGSSGHAAFKPDVAAPGVGIISTGVGTGALGFNNQGTSMAAPHVAGAAALLHQQHPDLSPSAIKALLQNSSVNASESGETGLTLQGSGVVRVDRAAALTSFAAPGGVSFGRLNPARTVTATERVVLTNLRRGSRTFAVTHVEHNTFPGVTISCPESVTVGSHRERAFNIRLRFDPLVSAAAGAFDDSAISQTEVDGWCILQDGEQTLRVGYIAVVDPASRLEVLQRDTALLVRNRGPAAGLAEAFTFVSHDSAEQADTYGSICSLGVRRGDPALYGGQDVIELGVSVDRAWEHISNLTVSLFLDTDLDGVDDVRLVAADWSSLSSTGVIGTYVTAQFDLTTGGAFLDWIAQGWDFNDQVAILPFTLVANGGLITDRFNYRLLLTDRQGAQDEQRGTIDLADEVVPDLNSFTLGAGERTAVGITRGEGELLWFLPGNQGVDQIQRTGWLSAPVSE